MAIPIRLHEVFADNHRDYRVYFFGSVVTTTVTSDPEVIDNWIYAITNFLDRFEDPMVGMGVQWYYRGYTPVATLQLNVGRRCLIIQLPRCRYVPESLREFFMDGRYTFVGIWNHSDERRLVQTDNDFEFADRPLDLRKYVKGGSLRRASFETIVEECLGYSGVSLETEISLSCWEDPILSLDQVCQATVKAHASFLIGKKYAWEFKFGSSSDDDDDDSNSE